MKKLSELVNFRNELNAFECQLTSSAINKEIAHAVHLVNSYPLSSDNVQEINNNYSAILEDIDKFKSNIDQLKAEVQKQIESQEKEWFQKSYQIYQEMDETSNPNYVLKEKINYNTKSKEHEMIRVTETRIGSQNDWRYAGLIIRPGILNYIDNMVGLDPLYVVDRTHELIAPSIEKFNEQYQRRLRPVVINESEYNEILHKVPNGQIGLALVNSFFNYRPFELIKRYLEEIYQKLQPGGVLIMSFNDCDLAGGVILVENRYACYTPGRLVRQLCDTIGYEIVNSWGDDAACVWLELKKPGTFTTLRGGQSLAKILPKTLTPAQQQEKFEEKERLRIEAARRLLEENEIGRKYPNRRKIQE